MSHFHNCPDCSADYICDETWCEYELDLPCDICILEFGKFIEESN